MLILCCEFKATGLLSRWFVCEGAVCCRRLMTLSACDFGGSLGMLGSPKSGVEPKAKTTTTIIKNLHLQEGKNCEAFIFLCVARLQSLFTILLSL